MSGIMNYITVHYHDGESFTLEEESSGIAEQNARGISEHETVDRVELLLETDGNLEKFYFLDGYAIPR